MFRIISNLFNKIRANDAEIERAENIYGLKLIGFFLVPVSICLFMMSFQVYQQSMWPRTSGTIIESSIEEPAESKNKLSILKLGYTYELGDKQFKGEGIISRSPKPEQLEKSRQEKYSKGSKIEIAFNPKAQSESRLASGLPYLPFVIFAVAIIAAIGSFKLIGLTNNRETIPPEDY